MLTGSHFLAALGWSSALLLPLYLAHIGASRTQIGSIMGAAAVGGLATRPLVGWALDRHGRRPVLAIATLLQSLGMALVALVRSVGVLAYAQRILFGMGAGTIFAGYFTFASDLVPNERRTEGLALFGLSGLMPLMLNPIMPSLALTGTELRWLFPALGAASLLSLLGLATLPETRPARAQRGDPARPRYRSLLAAPLWPVWIATVIFATQVSVFMAFATVAGQRRGLANPALLWLGYASGAALIRLLGGRHPDRWGPHNFVAPAIGVYASAGLLVAAAHSTPLALAAGLLGGLGHGYSFPVLTSQVATRSPQALRGAAMALFTAVWESSRLAFTPLFGLIADAHGDALMFTTLTLCAAAGLALWLLVEKRAAPLTSR